MGGGAGSGLCWLRVATCFLWVPEKRLWTLFHFKKKNLSWNTFGLIMSIGVCKRQRELESVNVKGKVQILNGGAQAAYAMDISSPGLATFS